MKVEETTVSTLTYSEQDLKKWALKNAKEQLNNPSITEEQIVMENNTIIVTTERITKGGDE